MPYSIFLDGIRFHAFHGLTRMEREIGVRYRVDVEMVADVSAAARTDSLADTIDYRKVHHLVVEVGRKESHRLIETLADRLAKRLLEAFPAEEVRVRVSKETPVLDGIVDAVGVEATRRRAAAGQGRRREGRGAARRGARDR